MAEQGFKVDREQLCCSICLILLEDPVRRVSGPCGHSYCRGCIETHEDQDDKRGTFSCCQQCRHYFEDGTVSVSKLVSTTPEPKTRAEFLQYSCPITLNPNTADQRLTLSKGNKKVTKMLEEQAYPHHPERFNGWYQVLSTEGLTGRCYWEVEWSGYDVYIAGSYKDIGRTGSPDDCLFGIYDKSWALRCHKGGCCFAYGGIETGIVPVSSRVGVYLDHDAGTLSFYSVSDTMTLLHTVQTTFTQILYPGFGFYSMFSPGDTAELCVMK